MLGKIKPDSQQNLFKTRLTNLINLGHPLVKLAAEVSWDKMEMEFQNLYSDQGRPSIPIRKIAGLLLLKEMFKESNESVVERWIEKPYWQYFTREDFFQNKQPFDPSEFVHYRKKLKEKGLEFVLSKTVALQRELVRKRFRGRAAIESTICHFKRNRDLGLNFLKGVYGEVNNALLVGIGYNLELIFNQIKEQILFWLNELFNFSTQNNILIFVKIKNGSF